MPIHISAKKKMRRDIKKEVHNKKIRTGVKSLVKVMRKNPSKENLAKAASGLDKAGKRGLLHPNKAARLKSRMSKLLASSLAK